MIREILPYFIFKRLFGDRKKYNNINFQKDKDWIKWQKSIFHTYLVERNHGIQKFVEQQGYKILKGINFKKKKILEIGPGVLPHLQYMDTFPKEYIIADINEKFLEVSKNILRKKKIKSKIIKINKRIKFSLRSESIDHILCFYTLEHLHNIKNYVNEFHRLLKKNGSLIFAIPNEGFAAWGLGRYFFTRSKAYKKGINYDKIICIEHPNFSDKILRELKAKFKCNKIKSYPKLPLNDFVFIKYGNLKKIN
jgi:2-polyprenyl-3-methyl-5-hydroxy-6-metoxy-1,4-benzoquinol methylase